MTDQAFDVICTSTDREKWLKERLNGVGSSDAPCILSISRFKSPFSIYAVKIGADDSTIDPMLAKWGHRCEPFVLEDFVEETGREVKLHGELLRSRERPWQMATLDAVQFDIAGGHDGPGVLEIKSTTVGDNWADGIPLEHQIQVQHQLAVTGWQWASIAVIVFQYGYHFYWQDIERDENLIRLISETEEEFWFEHVQKGVPPPVDGFASTTEALKKLYPTDNGETITLPFDLNDDDLERVNLESELKDLKAKKTLIDNRIKAALGEATNGVLGDVTYNYKADKNGTRTLRRVERGAA